MTEIENQLSLMKIKYDHLTEIRTKDGVSIFRVLNGYEAYILKYFIFEADKREILNYRILNNLNIPTLRIIASTERALLMNDINCSDKYRLGIENDMNDAEIAVQLAKWYKQLHSKGIDYIKFFGSNLYDESDVITYENIEFIKERTGTQTNEVWTMLFNKLNIIKAMLENMPKTLTYNDFYYTNLIAAKDKSEVIMYDYNLLGKGYVYSDIRNVTSSLGDRAKTTFIMEYGKFDEDEILIDNVVSPLTTLYFASKREVFPNWASKSLEQVKNGTLSIAIKRLEALEK